MFNSGRSDSGGQIPDELGKYDLTEIGSKAFINASAYMAGLKGLPVKPRFTRIESNGDGTITLEWSEEGLLESSPNVEDGYQPMPNAISPHTIQAQGIMFFRLKFK